MRRLFTVLIAILVLLPLAALAAAHWYLSSDALRTRAIAAVQRATGRELTIAGPIRLRWSLSTTIEANDVSLSNPAGFADPTFAHVERIEARIGLLPLLSRRVAIDRLLLVRPDLTLARDAQGRPNWIFTSPQPVSTAPATPSAPSGQFQTVLDAVEVQDARLSWQGVALTVPTLAINPVTGNVAGRLGLRGEMLALSGTAGPIRGEAWPIALRLDGAGVAATLTGSSAAARLAIDAADLSAASALAGRPLPPMKAVQLAASLSPRGLDGVRLEAGPSTLFGLALQSLVVTTPAVTLGGAVPITVHVTAENAALDGTGVINPPSALTLALTGHAGDLGRLGVGMPLLRDVTLAATLDVEPDRFAVHGLTFSSAQGDLAGEVSVALGAKPMLRGTLAARTFDLTALIPPPSPAPTAPAADPTAVAPPAPRARAIPETPLPFGRLNAADADLSLQIGDALWSGQHYQDVAAHLLLQAGVLKLDPARMSVGDKTVAVRFDADAGTGATHLVIDGPGLPAGPALRLLGAPGDSPGTLDFHVDLGGVGATPRAQAATLTGHIGLALVDAQVDNAWLQASFADALRAANLPLEAGGSSAVRCLALRVDAAAGHLTMPALSLDTNKLRLDGGGQIDLVDETLDLRLRPLLRLGTSLGVPVRLRGPLLAPKMALDPGALAPGRFGITIGGAAPPDTCAPALVLARGGEGPSPAVSMDPPAKPADFLRRLLR